ncbi:MAG: CotH kinase family protein [Nannocystaceae bacterium]
MAYRALPLTLAIALSGCHGDGAATAGSETATSTSTTGGETTEATTEAATTSAETGTSTTGTSTTTGSDTDESTSSGTTGEVDHYPEADDLFAVDAIAEFDLNLSENAILTLNVDPKTYVQGDLVAKIGGQIYDLPKIGVRIKGNAGSLRTLEEKAAFLLDFDRYTKDQSLLGLEKLAVNNMVQDCSMQREILGYTLFRDAGVPAPRAGYAVVRVNGEPYGLYTTVESVDNEVFLDHWYGGSKGNLYEGAYGTDLIPEKIPTFDQDNGSDVAFADLFAWAAALDAADDPDTLIPDLEAVMDVGEYLTFAAIEITLGHWDGYAWTRNNYFVHHPKNDGRWTFVPWGIDQTLRDHLGPFGGEGRIEAMCAGSSPCRQALAERFTDAVQRIDDLDLVGMAMALDQLTADAVAADPRKECDVASHKGSIADNIAFLQGRQQSVADGLLCTDPAMVDNDKDGYSACVDDCDDNDPKVHPGAPEVCDLDDDNCDGVWDEDPKCPHCVSKDLPGPGTALFCFAALPYDAAEADCKAQGGQLVSIHSQATQDWVKNEAFAIWGSDWWIGLNDRMNEGSFVWADGTPVDFTAWNEGEPNNAGNEDCVNIPAWTGGLWNDLPCDQSRPYVCRVP